MSRSVFASTAASLLLATATNAFAATPQPAAPAGENILGEKAGDGRMTPNERIQCMAIAAVPEVKATLSTPGQPAIPEVYFAQDRINGVKQLSVAKTVSNGVVFNYILTLDASAQVTYSGYMPSEGQFVISGAKPNILAPALNDRDKAARAAATSRNTVLDLQKALATEFTTLRDKCTEAEDAFKPKAAADSSKPKTPEPASDAKKKDSNGGGLSWSDIKHAAGKQLDKAGKYLSTRGAPTAELKDGTVVTWHPGRREDFETTVTEEIGNVVVGKPLYAPQAPSGQPAGSKGRHHPRPH